MTRDRHHLPNFGEGMLMTEREANWFLAGWCVFAAAFAVLTVYIMVLM